MTDIRDTLTKLSYNDALKLPEGTIFCLKSDFNSATDPQPSHNIVVGVKDLRQPDRTNLLDISVGANRRDASHFDRASFKDYAPETADYDRDNFGYLLEESWQDS